MTGKIGHVWARGSAAALVAAAMTFSVVPTVTVFAETNLEVNASAQRNTGEIPDNAIRVGKGLTAEGTYSSLTAALASDSVADGAYIVLESDLAESVTVSKNVTIDGAGKYSVTGHMTLQNGVLKNMTIASETDSLLTIGSGRENSIRMENVTVKYSVTKRAGGPAVTVGGNKADVVISGCRFVNSPQNDGATIDALQWSYGLYVNGQADEGSIQFVNNRFDGAFRTMLPNISGNVTIRDNVFVNSVYSVADGPTSGAGAEATCITTAAPSANDNFVITGNTFDNAGAFYFQQTEKANIQGNEFKFDAFEHYIQARGAAAHALDLTENTFVMGENDLVVVDRTAAPVKLPAGQRAVSFYPWVETPEATRPVDYSSYGYAYNEDGTVTFYPASQAALKAFLAPGDGNIGVNDGDTISLECDLTDTGSLFLSSDITFEGNGHIVGGDSSIHIGADAHATLNDIKFNGIHNAGGKLSAVYATGAFSGSLTVANCTFDSCDWDAIQITPDKGLSMAADITITNNVFKRTNAAINQQRYIHIESDMDKQTDFKVLVTDNKMYGNVAQEALGVYSVANQSIASLSGNYFAETVTYPTCIANYDQRWVILNKLAYPMADENLEERTDQVAIVSRDTWYADSYGMLVEALEAAGDAKAIALVRDAVVDGDALIKDLSLFDFNGKSITLKSGASIKAPADISANLKVPSNCGLVKSGDEANGYTFTVRVVSSGGGGSTTPSDKTEVEKNPDGSTTTTVTKPDGSQTITHETATGTESVVKKDKDGDVTSTEVTVSKQDAESGEVELPIEKSDPVAEVDKAPAVEVKVPATVSADKPIQVTVPVAKGDDSEPNYGVVVFAVDEDGNETLIPKTAVDEDGNVVFEATGNVTIKVVDNAKDMPDVKGTDWFAGDVVDFATARGIVNGVDMPDGTRQFQGYGKTTRGMFVAMLHNLELNPEAASDESLADVPSDAFYAGAAAWALEEGILSGVDMPDSSKQFQGGEDVTREQVAVFLMRYAQHLGMDVSKRADIDFPDASEVSGFAKDAMGWAVAEGLFKGDDKTGELNPADGAARAEVAAVLMRFINLMYA